MFSPTPEVVFDEETVIALHDALVAKTGGSEGVRDRGLLSSAVYLKRARRLPLL